MEEPIHFFDLALWYFQVLGDPVSIFAQANVGGWLKVSLTISPPCCVGLMAPTPLSARP